MKRLYDQPDEPYWRLYCACEDERRAIDVLDIRHQFCYCDPVLIWSHKDRKHALFGKVLDDVFLPDCLKLSAYRSRHRDSQVNAHLARSTAGEREAAPVVRVDNSRSLFAFPRVWVLFRKIALEQLGKGFNVGFLGKVVAWAAGLASRASRLLALS